MFLEQLILQHKAVSERRIDGYGIPMNFDLVPEVD
jgi:hypothetical protein